MLALDPAWCDAQVVGKLLLRHPGLRWPVLVCVAEYLAISRSNLTGRA
jgi:hypothetical protein